MICNTVQSLKQFIVKTGRFVLFIVGILYLCHAAALTFSPDYYEWLQRLNSPRMPLFEIFFYAIPFVIQGVCLVLIGFPKHWFREKPGSNH